jgi:hypothetical protein
VPFAVCHAGTRRDELRLYLHRRVLQPYFLSFRSLWTRPSSTFGCGPHMTHQHSLPDCHQPLEYIQQKTQRVHLLDPASTNDNFKSSSDISRLASVFIPVTAPTSTRTLTARPSAEHFRVTSAHSSVLQDEERPFPSSSSNGSCRPCHSAALVPWSQSSPYTVLNFSEVAFCNLTKWKLWSLNGSATPTRRKKQIALKRL